VEEGPPLYDLVVGNMVKMINASTKESYDQEWQIIKNSLAPHQQALSYLKGYYEKPHRIAAYMLDKVPLLLGKRGSSHAEQNHSSHVAYLGSDGARDIEDHIEGLIRRQSERVVQKRSRDYDHMTRSALCAEKLDSDFERLAMTTVL
jgi:hypothetical protein